MKVCLIGDFSENLDEGLKNIAHYTADYLAKRLKNDLIRIDINNILLPSQVRRIRSIDPDIIHYIPGPTNKSFFLLKIIKLCLHNNSRFILSAPHPSFNNRILSLLNFKPDYVIASSIQMNERMKRLRINSHLQPNGIDVSRFRPVSEFEKIKLREKYDLKNEFTVLHVGHIMAKRNLGIFKGLSTRVQSVIVASDYIKMDEDISESLNATGCSIYKGYFKDIEEFYQLADCYIFPVLPGDSILCPLSIMEAMSCNIPVITTGFDGIRSFFAEGNGLIFAESDDEFLDSIERIVDRNLHISTREMVMQYSWENISYNFIKIYNKMLSLE
jgi:glycosyltransferase involved in cell wall biosynthesis